jgi:hypothetical protein
MVTERERRKDRMDMASLVLAAAGLGLSVVALLNEKGEVVMANKIDSSKYSKRRDLKKAYAQEIKRTAVSEIGYTGTVIVLNEKGEQVQYGLVPLENRKIVKERETLPLPSKPPPGTWVAMEINSRNGKDRQAIVCGSREEAKAKALRMKNAHRPGSQQSKDCRQGYARVDTSRSIDVKSWFEGNEGTLYRV